MAGASSDGEMNYWPGFVDALANLVLALVFVVVIFTLALAVISSKVAQEIAAKEVAKVKEEQGKNAPPPDAAMPTSMQESPQTSTPAGPPMPPVTEAQKQEMVEEIARLKQELAQARQTAKRDNVKVAAQNEALPQAKKMQVKGSEIVFTYDPGAFELGPEPLAEFDKLLKARGDLAGKTFTLLAIPGSGPVTAEKRSAYYRMITLRNLLIERGAAPEKIQSKTSPDTVLPGLEGQVHLVIGGS